MLLRPQQQFFQTSVQPCPYIPGRGERKVLTELGPLDGEVLYNRLSRAGFRRSRYFAYRPACVDCFACVPVRIVVNEFCMSRSLRRLAQANADLTAGELPSRASLEQYHLFAQYLASRHNDSDMAEMNFDEYRAMVEDTPIDTRLITLRDTGANLIAVCLADVLDDGLSAVYSFYDPAEQKRSLGSFMIMQLVEHARRLKLPYVYLGYWIAESRKMAYKTRFRPLQRLGPDGWERMNEAELTRVGVP